MKSSNLLSTNNCDSLNRYTTVQFGSSDSYPQIRLPASNQLNRRCGVGSTLPECFHSSNPQRPEQNVNSIDDTFDYQQQKTSTIVQNHYQHFSRNNLLFASADGIYRNADSAAIDARNDATGIDSLTPTNCVTTTTTTNATKYCVECNKVSVSIQFSPPFNSNSGHSKALSSLSDLSNLCTSKGSSLLFDGRMCRTRQSTLLYCVFVLGVDGCRLRRNVQFFLFEWIRSELVSVWLEHVYWTGGGDSMDNWLRAVLQHAPVRHVFHFGGVVVRRVCIFLRSGLRIEQQKIQRINNNLSGVLHVTRLHRLRLSCESFARSS